MTSFFDFMTSVEVIEYVEKAWGIGYNTWLSAMGYISSFIMLASMVCSYFIVRRMITQRNRILLGKRCNVKKKVHCYGDSVCEETVTDFFKKTGNEFGQYLQEADTMKEYRGLGLIKAKEALEYLGTIGCEISIRKIK